jgi:hypothetical protein
MDRRPVPAAVLDRRGASGSVAHALADVKQTRKTAAPGEPPS